MLIRLTLFLLAWLSYAPPALAGWGDDWGEMVWGLPVSGPAVPSLPGVGLIGLALALSATAAWRLRRRRIALGLPLLLVLLSIPLVVAAGSLSIPNWFVNGEVADADEINENFDEIETEVKDNDSRLSEVEADTSANTYDVGVNASAIVTEETRASYAEATNAASISGETNARIAADAAHDTSIASNSTAISGESTARIASDSSLDTRLDAVESGSFTGGTLSLDNATSNLVDFGNEGVAPPADGSVGWKLRLYDSPNAGQDYGLGIESSTLWLAANTQFKFYIEDHFPGGTYFNHMTLSETALTLEEDLEVGGDLTVGGEVSAQPVVGKWRSSSGTSATAIEDVPWDIEDHNTSTDHFGWVPGRRFIQIKVAGYYMVAVVCLKDAMVEGEFGHVSIDRDDGSGSAQEEIGRLYSVAGGSYLGLSGTVVAYFNSNDRLVVEDGNSNNGLYSGQTYNYLSVHKLN